MSEYPAELTFTISGRFHAAIFNQTKEYEGRPWNSRLVKTTRAGNLLKIVNPDTGDWFLAERLEVFYYPNVAAMLKSPMHPLPEMLPGVASIEEGIELYRGFNERPNAVNEEYCAVRLLTRSEMHTRDE